MVKLVPVRKLTALRLFPALWLLGFGLASFTLPDSRSTDNRSLSVRHSDTITVIKQISSRKYKIRLYPDARQEVLFFNANGEKGRVFQLFMFNLDGQLVKQVYIRSSETVVIDRIEKGDYLFEVFSDDERLENGQVNVR